MAAVPVTFAEALNVSDLPSESSSSGSSGGHGDIFCSPYSIHVGSYGAASTVEKIALR